VGISEEIEFFEGARFEVVEILSETKEATGNSRKHKVIEKVRALKDQKL
jgi:hypothetical protein